MLQGFFVPFARVGSGDPVRVLRLLHNKYTGYIEAFITETYVQLVTTESMCYSISWSALLQRQLANAPTLYCEVPYAVACVDVSRTVLSGPFIAQL